MKVGIVGVGRVGSSIAFSTLQTGFATELLLNDQREQLAQGEAMDLRHAAAFYPAANVYAADVEDMADADAIVIAAGRGGRAGEPRLALLRDNVSIARAVGMRLRAFKGLVVVVSNPVDVMTQVVQETSGLPPSRVLGTGTMLDTARLRQIISRSLGLDPRGIHAHMIGEHGQSVVAAWSCATIGGLPLRSWPGWNRADEPTVAEEVRRAAQDIIVRRGVSSHAIGLLTATLLRWLLRCRRRVVTVTTVQQGALGLRDVALSLPTLVGKDGVSCVLEPELNPAEHEALALSANIVRSAVADAQKLSPAPP